MHYLFTHFILRSLPRSVFVLISTEIMHGMLICIYLDGLVLITGKRGRTGNNLWFFPCRRQCCNKLSLNEKQREGMPIANHLFALSYLATLDIETIPNKNDDAVFFFCLRSHTASSSVSCLSTFVARRAVAKKKPHRTCCFVQY